MKVKEGFKLRNVAGMMVAVPTGAAADNYNNMLMLNEISTFLWNHMQQDTTEAALCAAVLEAYEVDAEHAAKSVHQFVETLRQEDILDT